MAAFYHFTPLPDGAVVVYKRADRFRHITTVRVQNTIKHILFVRCLFHCDIFDVKICILIQIRTLIDFLRLS